MKKSVRQKLKQSGIIQLVGNIHLDSISQSKKRNNIRKAMKPRGYYIGGKLIKL